MRRGDFGLPVWGNICIESPVGDENYSIFIFLSSLKIFVSKIIGMQLLTRDSRHASRRNVRPRKASKDMQRKEQMDILLHLLACELSWRDLKSCKCTGYLLEAPVHSYTYSVD